MLLSRRISTFEQKTSGLSRLSPAHDTTEHSSFLAWNAVNSALHQRSRGFGIEGTSGILAKYINSDDWTTK